MEYHILVKGTDHVFFEFSFHFALNEAFWCFGAFVSLEALHLKGGIYD